MGRSRRTVLINLAFSVGLWLLSLALMVLYLDGPHWFIEIVAPAHWYMWAGLLFGLCLGMFGTAFWIGKLGDPT